MAFITPTIDGQVTTFYEWSNAGIYALDDPMGAMHMSEKSFETIYYGFDLSNLYIRIDISRNVSMQKLQQCQGMIDLITDSAIYQLKFSFDKDMVVSLYALNNSVPEEINDFTGAGSYDNIIELACPFKFLNVTENDVVQLSVTLMNDDIILEKWPKYGFINVRVPDPSFEDSVWSA